MLLFVSKLLVAWWITLMSAIGVWLPVFYVGRNREEPLVEIGAFARCKKATLIASSATVKWYLSLANCVSAGMLLTMALLHFFPESFEAGALGALPAPTSLCFWLLAGILIPAVLERSMKGGSGHSHGVSSETGSSSSGGGTVSVATLLIVLMCFHGVTEGLLLGFEEKVSALLSAALPLSIHKLFDGLVIGVAVAKEMLNQSAEATPSPSLAEAEGRLTEKGPRSSMREWRRLYQSSVGVWLLLTPITMICVVLCTVVMQRRDGLAVVGNISTQPPVVLPLSSTSAPELAPFVSMLAAVQAMGSGSFIYIGLGILNREDLVGVSANAALLAGVVLTGGLFFISSSSH
ncbi:hypothetical protein ABB37_07658 [Leptomonas pyrrhocoris]|uniref:Uncharacterized protein n=1 Tax=Leptomonas pyrrhocoris TaxID=157538 RepID=A0A0M9FVJ0_LEPPY|nr:hypothetical protein ABB37_07658 [Leptomonas pyrrhocoris]KPA76863.1 hypothetical protein ABB37_07658 [Leptomonas pyrrhocoris]|eukprot:XP_015655302.1 hypothetical protein ABB37_07658 [Leptomonas pyrrhocoris]